MSGELFSSNCPIMRTLHQNSPGIWVAKNAKNDSLPHPSIDIAVYFGKQHWNKQSNYRCWTIIACNHPHHQILSREEMTWLEWPNSRRASNQLNAKSPHLHLRPEKRRNQCDLKIKRIWKRKRKLRTNFQKAASVDVIISGDMLASEVSAEYQKLSQ